MAAIYTLVGSVPSLRVLSPTVSQPIITATIQTAPTGIIAAYPLDEADFNAGTANVLLDGFATAIETIISQGHAIGGTGTSELDANGLIEYYVTFTVGYNPPGAPSGQVTAEVDVPVGLLQTGDSFAGVSPLGEAEALVDAAYNNLVKLSQG